MNSLAKVPKSSKKKRVGSGNTKTNPQISPAKHWFFTLNNYTEEELLDIINIDSSIVPKYMIEHEVGEEGTPHLQGHLTFKKKVRPISELKNKRIHFEKTRNEIKAVNYCMKDFIKGKSDKIWYRGYKKPYRVDIELYDWQLKIKNEILDVEPDDRTIYWVWEEKGCAGKTTFQKWIYQRYPHTVVLSGKAADMKHGIVEYGKSKGCYPEIVLINIPRCNKGFVSWTGIEEIKDMFFFSTKYETGMIDSWNPHVIIFANTPPNEEIMSSDRWKIIDINQE